ncbi:hypothetical protein [Peribacillus sp. NPDC097895]
MAASLITIIFLIGKWIVDNVQLIEGIGGKILLICFPNILFRSELA